MKTLTMPVTAFALAAALAGLAAGAADLDATIANCNGCHGPGGVSVHAVMPTIAGISEFVHFDALLAYADGARPCEKSKYLHGDTSLAATDMCTVARDLSEADMEAISQHYAAKPFVPAKQAFDADLAAKGKALHDEHCEKCHSGGGSVAEDDAGILAGQHMAYLVRMFEEYAAGEREQPKSMKSRLDQLSKEDTDALAHYYGSQQ